LSHDDRGIYSHENIQVSDDERGMRLVVQDHLFDEDNEIKYYETNRLFDDDEIEIVSMVIDHLYEYDDEQNDDIIP